MTDITKRDDERMPSKKALRLCRLLPSAPLWIALVYMYIATARYAAGYGAGSKASDSKWDRWEDILGFLGLLTYSIGPLAALIGIILIITQPYSKIDRRYGFNLLIGAFYWFIAGCFLFFGFVTYFYLPFTR
ncbi:MAG TPA: hypothetical protein VF719_09350 [Abditibacteriaceae bacterium]